MYVCRWNHLLSLANCHPDTPERVYNKRGKNIRHFLKDTVLHLELKGHLEYVQETWFGKRSWKIRETDMQGLLCCYMYLDPVSILCKVSGAEIR
jgi:hypothetical protein